MISALINTFNEARHINLAIRSLKELAGEVVVVDMLSEDGTPEIAAAAGARVFSHQRCGFVEPARQFGIAKCRGSWLMVLDADEIITPRLAGRLGQIASEDSADIVLIPRINYFFGRAMAHSGVGPEQDRQARFFKRGSLHFPPRIHSVSLARDARLLKLPVREGAILHFTYDTLQQYLEKFNRYTSIEAAQAKERGERPNALRTSWSAAKEIALRYFMRGGYRDGWRGLFVCLAMAAYRVASDCKLREIEEFPGPTAVLAAYSQIAEGHLRPSQEQPCTK